MPCRLGFDPSGLWVAYTGLAGLMIGYNVLGYLLLRFLKPRYLPLSTHGSTHPADAAGSHAVEQQKAH